jgi:Adenylate and Guanylate cyclase catalytic domain
MESTGKADQIHISSATADILIAAGKNHWVCAREEVVEAKGKGCLQTFWLNVDSGRKEMRSSGEQESTGHSMTLSDSRSENDAIGKSDFAKRDRLVNWMVELLSGQVRKLVSILHYFFSKLRPH